MVNERECETHNRNPGAAVSAALLHITPTPYASVQVPFLVAAPRSSLPTGHCHFNSTQCGIGCFHISLVEKNKIIPKRTPRAPTPKQDPVHVSAFPLVNF